MRLFLLGVTLLLAACQPPQPLTEEAFQPIEINKTVWVVPGNNAFVIDAAREARQDFRSTLAIEVREADDENQMGVIFSQYVNRPVETYGNPSGAVQRFDRGLPPSVAGAFTEEAHKREVTMAGGSVVSSRSFERGRETTYRDRNGDTCVMVGNGRLRDASQGEAGGYDFVNHAVLCGPADTRAAFTSYVRAGGIAPRVARVDGDPKELKLPTLPQSAEIPVPAGSVQIMPPELRQRAVRAAIWMGAALVVSGCETTPVPLMAADPAPGNFTPERIVDLRWGDVVPGVGFEAYRAEKAEGTDVTILRVFARHRTLAGAEGFVTVNYPTTVYRGGYRGSDMRAGEPNRTFSMGGSTVAALLSEAGQRAQVAALDGARVISTHPAAPERSWETTFERAGATCILATGARPGDDAQRRANGGYSWVAVGRFCGDDSLRQEFSRYVRENGFGKNLPLTR